MILYCIGQYLCIHLQDNVAALLAVTEHHELPVFLIDPDILRDVMSNKSRIQSPCKYLCNSMTIVAFAALYSKWQPVQVVL